MYRVLFVDDEILVRKNISEIIQWNALGFELAGTCENGKDAVAFLEKHSVDVVITDIAMPYMDGLELSKYLYEHFPKTVVVIFSGYDSFSYAKMAIRYRVSEYILKPITARELREVLEKIREKLDGEKEKEENLQRLMQGYVQFTKNEETIISRALVKLVQGTQNLPELKKELKEYGIDISGKAFRVLGISLDADDIDEAREDAVMKQIRSEIQNGYGVWLVFKNSDHEIFLLAGTNRPLAFQKEVYRICHSIQKGLYNAQKMKVTIGIGETVQSLEELPKSCQSAIQALEYRYAKAGGVLLDSETIWEEEKLEEFEERLRSLKQAIKKDDKGLVREILNGFESYVGSVYISKNKVIAYLFQLLRGVYEEFCQLQMNVSWDESKASKIIGVGSFQDAMKVVREFIFSGMKSYEHTSRTSNEKLVLRAMDYLKTNYGNPDLSLSMLCEYLNISVSHFTNIFKEETGKTFKEVLTFIRIEKAKQLLKQTDMKNYEVAEKIGCKDPHYFTVLFKKTTGKTPKEYAKEL